MRRHLVGVIGAARPSPKGYALAHEVGRLLADAGVVLVCGGLGGVMEAAAQGCCDAGGEVIGLLPGADAKAANPFVTLAVPTNMGHARNVIIAHSAEVLIAVEGEYGTLSEMAIALKLGRAVFALSPSHLLPEVHVVDSPTEAVERALRCLDPDFRGIQ